EVDLVVEPAAIGPRAGRVDDAVEDLVAIHGHREAHAAPLTVPLPVPLHAHAEAEDGVRGHLEVEAELRVRRCCQARPGPDALPGVAGLEPGRVPPEARHPPRPERGEGRGGGGYTPAPGGVGRPGGGIPPAQSRHTPAAPARTVATAARRGSRLIRASWRRSCSPVEGTVHF